MDFQQKLQSAIDHRRLNSNEGETTKSIATLQDPLGDSKQFMAEIRQLLHLTASSSKLPVAAPNRPWAGSNWSSVVCHQPSSQIDNTAEATSFRQYVVGQQSSERSIVESLQQSEARKQPEASQVPQLYELPECPMPFGSEFYEPMTEERGLRKSVGPQSNLDFRKPISHELELYKPMPRDRELLKSKPLNSDSLKADITGTEIPPEPVLPGAFPKTDFPVPEIAFIGADQSKAPNERLLFSNEALRDVSISVRKGLITGQSVHPMAKDKSASDIEASVSQVVPFVRGPLTHIDGKTSLAANLSIESHTAPSVREYDGDITERSNNAAASLEELSLYYRGIDLIPPPAEFATDDLLTDTTASQTNYQSVVCNREPSSIQGATDNDLCPNNNPFNSSVKGSARTADLGIAFIASVTNDASTGFKASTSRSLMRPKIPPPLPPSRLRNQEIGSFYGGAIESGFATTAREPVSRKSRNNDTVDRISLCQYGRDTALEIIKAETITIRVKASSTANLVEEVGLSPRFTARPEPPRRSCSIPRKPSTHSLSEWVRVDPDGSSDDQKQSPEARFSGNASTMCLRNGTFLRSSTPFKAFGGESGGSDRVKPTAQIRPNAIRAISSSSVSVGAKYFPNVESLIQQYSQTDDSAATTWEFKTAGKGGASKSASKSSGSTSKFGTLKGRLRDYVTTSSTKKQTFSYSVSSKTSTHVTDKNGSKLIKAQTGTWEPKPTDYQKDEGETPPESSSDTKPNYISSYLSFAGPKPYAPPRTVSSLVTKNEDLPSLTTFKTFIGSRIASCSSIASEKDSLAKFRTESSSQSVTGSPPSSSGSPPDSKIDMINEWLESRSVDCNSPLCDSENQSPTKLELFRTDSGPEEALFRKNESTVVFTREPPPKMSTFRTSGSISVNSSFVPEGNSNKVTSPGNSRRPVFPGVITSPGITNRSSIPCVKKEHSKTLPRNVRGRSRNLSGSEEKALVRSPILFNRSPLGCNKAPKESDKDVENRPNGMKELPAESAFENVDCIVTGLVEKLRSTFSEETDRAQDVEASKERLVSLTRQFVADSQNLVSSATQNRDRLVQSVTTSSETLSRIVDHCLGTASAMGPTSQAVILNNRVMDLTGAYRATMIAARVAVGKPLSCPEMKALMKQATSLAAILSSLIKLLNRL